MLTEKDNDSMYNTYVRCCDELGIDIIPFLDRMIVFDYIIANTDRHTNNFGLIRDPVSLEWLGPAPLFDSGSSLGFDCTTQDIMMSAGRTTKPFNENPEKQLRLVKDLSWLDFDALNRSIERSKDVLMSSRYIDETRADAILGMMRRRASRIERLAGFIQNV